MNEVARRANVSVATVSHVLNHTRNVSAPVRARVEAAVTELGYLPNAVARSLRMRHSKTVAMMIPNIGNPFFAELVRGVEDECFRQGYSLILCNSEDNRAKQAGYLRVLMSRRIDGLALVSAGADQDLRALLRSIRVPVVIVDREIKGVTADLVEVDHEHGGYLAARHLLELGHRRIAMIAGPRGLPVSVQRLHGFKRALADAGVGLSGGYLMHRDFTLADGYEATRKLLALQPPPTALFAGNDLLALGALHAAHESALVPGKDLSVVGFDDVAFATYIRPRLTTVRQPKQRIGEEAAKLLIERMNGARRHACHKIFAPDLLRGETTGAAPGHVDGKEPATRQRGRLKAAKRRP